MMLHTLLQVKADRDDKSFNQTKSVQYENVQR